MWSSLFSLPGVDDGMSVPVTNRANEYLRIFGDSGAIYDLDQTPTGRPRLARSGSALFTLTAHTRLAWCPEELKQEPTHLRVVGKYTRKVMDVSLKHILNFHICEFFFEICCLF